MVLGLGTGSTAKHMVYGLAARLKDGRLRNIVGVPTSSQAGALARELGIPLATLEEHPQLDLALDGADEVDPALNLIKGLGGALLYEKIVESSTKRLIIMADESKLVEQLGTHVPLPVEVIAFGLPLSTDSLAALGCEPVLRRTADNRPYRTDEGNMILDCHFRPYPRRAGAWSGDQGYPRRGRAWPVYRHGLGRAGRRRAWRDDDAAARCCVRIFKTNIFQITESSV